MQKFHIISSSDFSKVLCDDRHSKGSKSNFLKILQDNFGYSRHAGDLEYSRFSEKQICNIEYFFVDVFLMFLEKSEVSFS